MARKPAIGIDLGTTNSLVSIVVDGTPQILADDQGRKSIPSIVSFPESGGALIGHDARAQVVNDPENTVCSFKRLIGRKYSEPAVRRIRSWVPYKLVEAPDGNVAIVTRQEVVPVVEFSAMVLRRIAEIAQRTVGGGQLSAVITVPANFNDRQREYTRVAGRIAGLNVLRIVNEPTAAALCFGFDGTRDGRVAVYDFGGGTFDVSVVDIRRGVFRVLATAGDPFLGGDDIDLAVAGRIADIFRREHRIDLRRRHAEWQRLQFAAERAKRALSTDQATEVVVSEAAFAAGGAVDLKMPFRRSDLVSVAFQFVERSVALARRCLDAANLSTKDIDEVILVGGSSHLPLVPDAVAELFGREPLGAVDPMEAVALGAAMQAAMLSGVPVRAPTQQGDGSALLLDVLPHTIGLAVAGGGVEPVLKRHSVVPTQEVRNYTTWRDGQTDLRLRLLQGDSSKASENTVLGDFVVSDLRKARAGDVSVRVVFEVDANGILNVTAKDLDSGRECSRRLKLSTLDEGSIAESAQRVSGEEVNR